ncbi:MAG: hypothetical protein MUO31_15670 [Thermodesulfovibrionales bacterium]|nr:hypothetical protein [Thermodesulfovibrionales bacterium]
MNEIQGYINKYFNFLIKELGFSKKEENSDNSEFFNVTFANSLMGVTIEKYRREIYMSIFNCANAEKKVDIYNLINYLEQDKKKYLKSKFFTKEHNLEECFRLQIEWLAELLIKYFPKIKEFISNEKSDQHFADVTKYIIKKHPELFKN